MTAHAMKGDRERCLESGMDDYIAKPIRSHDLFAAFVRTLGDGVLLPDQPTAEKPQPRINWRKAMDAVDGDQDLLREIVGVFLAETPKLLAELETGIARGDATTAERAAHTLKGSLRPFEATAALELAGELEAFARQRNLAPCGDKLPALQQEFVHIQKELQAWLAAAPAATRGAE